MNAPRCLQCGYAYPLPTAQPGSPPAYPPLSPAAQREFARQLPPDAIQVAPGTHVVMNAVLSSIAAVGFGQLYNKQTGKGILLMSLAVLLVLGCIAYAFSDWIKALILFLVAAPIMIVIATLDAANIAGKLNRGEVVRKWQWF